MIFIPTNKLIWKKECKKSFFEPQQTNETMVKMIELLVTLNFSPANLFASLITTPWMTNLASFHQQKL